MSDLLDLRKSQQDFSSASKIYYDALIDEREANIALKSKKQQIKLDNMEALLSKDMTAAVHKVKVESETFEEELIMDTAKYNRKMCQTQLDSLREKHYTLKKELTNT